MFLMQLKKQIILIVVMLQMSGLGKSPLAGLAALGLGGLAPANTGGLNPAGISTTTTKILYH